jgi:outer membrane cobalamin receptor
MKSILLFTKFTYLLLLLFTHSIYAQKDSIPPFLSSVQEILRVAPKKVADEELSIAGRFSQTEEQAPSVVSVITKAEIKLWGARDVADILRLIQGFEFGIDVQSLFGLGFRGMWGHEGKILLMIDGKTVNCFGYGNTNFFGTYPASMIERIEIIRGPGSALYGGFAEVAVINIITPKGSQYNGIQTNISTGMLGNLSPNGLTFNGNIGAGIKRNDFELSIQAGYNYTPVSTQIYKDFTNQTLQLGNEFSWRQWQHLLAKLQYKTLSISYHRNETNYLAQTQTGIILPTVDGQPLNLLRNYTETIQLNYIFNSKKHWSVEILTDLTRGNPITSRVVSNLVKSQTGGFTISDSSSMWENLLAKGYKAKTETYIHYDELAFGRLTIGGGYQLDAINSFQLDGLPGLQTSQNAADTSYWATNSTYYALLQYTKQIKNFGLTIGNRYENTRFGAAFAPRIGLTYVYKGLNIKLLYGRAFRVPLLWQAYSRQYISSQNVLTPEIADTFECEIGYQFTTKLSAKINAYLINIDKPITYIGGIGSYQNFGQAGSQGIEGELNYKAEKAGAFVNFSYNIPVATTSPIFLSANRQDFLGLPSLKMNIGMYFIWKKLSIAPSFTYIGTRYGQFEEKPDDNTKNTVYQAVLLSNLTIAYSFSKKFDMNLSTHNIFDADYRLIQPYYGGHATIPINNRQITVGLIWKINL